MNIWVIYDHPKDVPDFYVARRWENDRPTGEAYFDRDIEALRSLFRKLGFVCLKRAENDDPVIMETWL
jgi:hypothetical protein